AADEDLDHEHRVEPRGALRIERGPLRNVHGGLAPARAADVRLKLAQLLAREAGPYPPRIHPALLRVGARQQQRTDPLPGALAGRGANHGKLHAFDPLGLAPLLAAPVVVGALRL